MIGQKKKTLYVVCEDNMSIVSNYISKLIYSNDDIKTEEENKTVGVEDKSTNLICCDYDSWNNQNEQIVNKVLFINEKEADKELAPIIDVKYDSYGIKYGWAGRQAYIKADPTILIDSVNEYEKFYNEYSKIVKISGVFKDKLLTSDDINKTNSKVLDKIKAFSQNVEEKIEKVKQKKNIHIQQTLFAVQKFYIDYLNEFLNQ